MTKIRALYAALGLAILFAAAVTAYALHARDSAIRGWAEAERVSQDRSRAIKALAAKKVLRDAGLESDHPGLEAIEATRDLVYRKTKVGNERSSPPDWQRYLKTVDGEFQQICSGMSLTYKFALDALEIPNRIAALASKSHLDGDALGDTHSTVEVFHNGKWFVSDPTFNVHFDCSDGSRFLSIPEMQACIKKGRELVPVPGKTQIAGRTVAENYLPYEKLLYAYSRNAATAQGNHYAFEESPSGWGAKAKSLYP